jgi:hypothetical protein
VRYGLLDVSNVTADPGPYASGSAEQHQDLADDLTREFVRVGCPPRNAVHESAALIRAEADAALLDLKTRIAPLSEATRTAAPPPTPRKNPKFVESV